jgi:hypothetical protein
MIAAKAIRSHWFGKTRRLTDASEFNIDGFRSEGRTPSGSQAALDPDGSRTPYDIENRPPIDALGQAM